MYMPTPSISQTAVFSFTVFVHIGPKTGGGGERGGEGGGHYPEHGNQGWLNRSLSSRGTVAMLVFVNMACVNKYCTSEKFYLQEH